MPGMTDDLLAERDGVVGVREKSLRPLVGFCGYVGSVWKRRLYQWSGRSDKAIGLVLRDRALRQLKGSARIETAFIERTDVWGGAVVSGGYDEHKREAVREEFVSNLVGSDYGLCLRGKGNYSFRLYEIFAVGRIPLFIDTECVLPFEDEIDWRRHCVWVDAQDINRIDEILAQFHADIAPDDFRQLQLDNRRLWEEWLRPQAFYARMLERALRDGGR